MMPTENMAHQPVVTVFGYILASFLCGIELGLRSIGQSRKNRRQALIS